MIKTWLYNRRQAKVQALDHEAQALWALMRAQPGEDDELIARIARIYARMTIIETKLNINPLNKVLA